MKIASFNANGIRARLPIIQDWLKNEGPDVLCIQETKVQDKDFPIEAFQGLGYNSMFKGQKSYNGVAVLSREMPTKVFFGFDDEDVEEQPRIVTVYIHDLPIVNTYIPQGTAPDSEKFKYKLNWFKRLNGYFTKNFKPGEPLLWVGDFNVAPESIDVYDPEKLSGSIGFHPEEHKALSAVKSWGFVDVFRMHNPDLRAYTFWDYRAPYALKRGLGWRIDHIWATSCLAEKSNSAWIDVGPRQMERPSDHTFLVAEFDIK
ncbi:MAG: exodeoxyribonuclease III [Thermodesulfobacteriota bacterium]|nr:exodeoxyribonuclease III [Thermodesulfobacteriota bacterium]